MDDEMELVFRRIRHLVRLFDLIDHDLTGLKKMRVRHERMIERLGAIQKELKKKLYSRMN
jgi:hypothetical protein